MIFVVILNCLLFVFGNFIFTVSAPVMYQVALSELIFILLYTFIDKGNIKYGYKFTALSVLASLHFMLPAYGWLFYSQSVQIMSVLISASAILLNSIVIRQLLNKGLTKLFSSRASTTVASILEISMFSYLLDIGLIGAMYAVLFRSFYIFAVTKNIFQN